MVSESSSACSRLQPLTSVRMGVRLPGSRRSTYHVITRFPASSCMKPSLIQSLSVSIARLSSRAYRTIYKSSRRPAGHRCPPVWAFHRGSSTPPASSLRALFLILGLFAPRQPCGTDSPVPAPDGRAAIGGPSLRAGPWYPGWTGRVLAYARSAGPRPRSLSASVPARGAVRTPERLFWFLFGEGRCPSGPGSRASHRAPAEPGLGPCGLRSLSRAPRRPHFASPVAWLHGGRSAAWGRWVARARRRRAATVRRRAREGPITGPCEPAGRSTGAADRRPRRAPPGTPCP